MLPAEENFSDIKRLEKDDYYIHGKRGSHLITLSEMGRMFIVHVVSTLALKKPNGSICTVDLFM